MDLQDLRDYVRRMLNEDGESEGFYSDTELNVYINEAYKELVNIHPINSELYELYDSQDYTSVSGTSTYALPSDFNKLLGVKYGSYYCSILNYSLYTAMGDNRNYTASAVFPLAYLKGTNLVVSPTPSDSATTITLAYIHTPVDLSGDTDEPEVKETLHELIGLGALERAKVKDNEIEEGKYHFARMRKKLYDTYGMLTPEEQAALRR